MGTPSLNTSEETKNDLFWEKKDFLLKTKFHIPPPFSTQITRLRLIKLINGGLDRPLTLVSAPAGYGKTTLVSNWLKETGMPSTWLSLDEGDNDPICFINYFLNALMTIVPGIEENILDMTRGIQPNQIERIVNLLVNELAQNINPFIFVIDDFHVIQSDAVLQIVTYFIEHMPNQLHLVIITRVDPPIALSRLRVRNQLLDIRAEHLRFTHQEIAAFLVEKMGLALSEEDISILEARTEGWIASLQLAALSMKGCEDIQVFVSTFSGSHHYVMDYLVEEVLKQQSSIVNTFLLQTSILGRLCGSLCSAILNVEQFDTINGQTMLEELEEANLFLIPLDDEHKWFRYHHLFMDVLKKRLEKQFPLLLSDLHKRASRWYEENGFISESIQHALLAGDQERAADLIEQNGCYLLIRGEVGTMLKWTNAIDFESDRRIWLSIQKAWALALSGDLARVEPILQAPERILNSLEPTPEVNTMLGTIAAARAHCANVRKNTRLTAYYAHKALDLLPDCSSISLSIRSASVSILGDASSIDGNLEEAVAAYNEAIRIGQNAGNQSMEIIAKCDLADVLVEKGQLQQAKKIYLMALQMALQPDGQRSPLAGRCYYGLALIAYENNQLIDADQYIKQSINFSRIWGDTNLQTIAWTYLARIEQANGNIEKANEAIHEAEQLASLNSISPKGIARMRLNMHRVWFAQDRLENISPSFQSKKSFEDEVIPYQKESEYLILLRLLLHKTDYDSALELSERWVKQVDHPGRTRLVVELLILGALAYQGKKQTEQAITYLEKALDLAQPEDYIRVFLDEGEKITRLLCGVQSRQGGSSYASALLDTIDKTPGMTPPSMQLLVEPLTLRELEVIKFIESGFSNQDIAERLVISIPTVKRHISNIYSKLGVKNRTQAVAIGKELKLFI